MPAREYLEELLGLAKTYEEDSLGNKEAKILLDCPMEQNLAEFIKKSKITESNVDIPEQTGKRLSQMRLKYYNNLSEEQDFDQKKIAKTLQYHVQ